MNINMTYDIRKCYDAIINLNKYSDYITYISMLVNDKSGLLTPLVRVSFQVFTAVIMKLRVLCDAAP
jgi:hypothetical protein